MHEPTETYLVFTRPLNALGVDYMVTGSIAATYYGEPRLTNDVDIVIVIDSSQIASFARHFPPGDFYCPPPEIIRIECSRYRRGHFNLIHHQTGYKADIYPAQSDDPLHQWGLLHRRKAEIDGELIYIAPPEYVILRKLQYYREGQSQKHLNDIRAMLETLGPEWDRTTLEAMLTQHNLTQEWAHLPPSATNQKI
ncbi:MAG TPA: hypothetical protein PKE55_03155 [Kiritimatiellia bacterium]|nr:hypothetical protein [Kiritimatiellia bacterium]